MLFGWQQADTEERKEGNSLEKKKRQTSLFSFISVGSSAMNQCGRAIKPASRRLDTRPFHNRRERVRECLISLFADTRKVTGNVYPLCERSRAHTHSGGGPCVSYFD